MRRLNRRRYVTYPGWHRLTTFFLWAFNLVHLHGMEWNVYIYIYSIYYTTQLYRDYKKPIQGSPLKNQDFSWISHWVGFDHCSYGFNWFWSVGADFADHVWVPKKSCLVMSRFTPWKFNSSPLKISHPKRKVIFKPSFFRGYVKLRGCSSCCFKCFFTKQKPWPSHSLASKIIFQNLEKQMLFFLAGKFQSANG